MINTLATVSNVPMAMPCVQQRMHRTRTEVAEGISAVETAVAKSAVAMTGVPDVGWTSNNTPPTALPTRYPNERNVKTKVSSVGVEFVWCCNWRNAAPREAISRPRAT